MSECGRLKPFSLITKSGPFLVEQDTCVDFCPTGWSATEDYHCLEPIGGNCASSEIISGKNIAWCTDCIDGVDETPTITPPGYVTCQ